jgi:cation diffusion facilitator CzcD-associated flavoprotein CzcO
LIITATGFNLSVLGDIPFIVDGKPVDFAQTVTYRGMMFTGVPNMAWVFGYFRASWTLRVDLMGDFICRLLKHMDDLHVATVTPQLRPQDAAMPIGSWMDPENFNPNYLMRSQHLMPKRGNISEWQHNQDYWVEREILPTASLTDGCLTFS